MAPSLCIGIRASLFSMQKQIWVQTEQISIGESPVSKNEHEQNILI